MGASEDPSEASRGGKKKGKKSFAQIKKEKTEKIMGKKQVKPKRPMSAYFFFANENRLKLKEKNPDMNIKDIARANSAAWKELSAEDRKPYNAMVSKDRIRYEKELKQLDELGYFFNSDGVKSTDLDEKGNKREFPEGTVMPKKVRSSYLYFFTECQKESKANKAEGEKSNVSAVTKEISTKWKSMSEADKQKYEDMHKKD